MSRVLTAKRADSRGEAEIHLCVFATEIGWMGFMGRSGVVHSAWIGHPSEASVRKAVKQSCQAAAAPTNFPVLSDWNPELREALQDYAKGQRIAFDKFEIQLPDQTPFRDKVLAVTRKLGYGETTSYGELARAVGHPGAARAVGTVMSTNRFPILIPCHRVLAAGGKLGGYSSPAGTDLKQRLLQMEQSV